jgi:hypothetical protein
MKIPRARQNAHIAGMARLLRGIGGMWPAVVLRRLV